MIHQSNRIYAPILIAVSILVVIFALKPFYADYKDISTELGILESTKNTKEKIKTDLVLMKESLNSAS